MAVQKRDRSGQIRWIGRYRGPDGKERSKTFETRKAAKDWVTEREREMRRGEWIDPGMGKVTVGEVVMQWRDLTENAGTRRVRQHLLDNLGDLERTPVGKLTARQLREWVAKMLGGRPWADGAPLDETTVRNLGGQLTGALGLAVEDGHLMKAPKIVTPKSEGRHIARAELLTPEQVFELAADARAGRARIKGEREGRRGDARFARMILVAAGTGMRVGELCGLRVSSVDFLRREIHVIEQAAGGSEFGWAKLKTPQSRRTIPVGDSVIALLAEELAENPTEDRSLPIFRTARERMWSPTTVANRFVIVRRDCGLPDGKSFHDLRHFFASTLIFAGASVPMVAQYLGHKSPAVTLDVYAHLWPGDDERARDAVDAILVRDQCGTGNRTGPMSVRE